MATLFSYFKKSPAPNKNNIVPTKKSKVEDKSPGTPLTTNNNNNNNKTFLVGELVWAKLDTYPFWPALVCKDPATNKHLKSYLEVHVQFFGEPPTHDWVKISNVKQFDELQPSNEEDLKIAFKQAEAALNLTLPERIDLYYVCKASDSDEDTKKPKLNTRKRLRLISDSEDDLDKENIEDEESPYEPTEDVSSEEYDSVQSDDETENKKKRKRKSSNTQQKQIKKKLTNVTSLNVTPSVKKTSTPINVTSSEKMNQSIDKAQTVLAKFASSGQSTPTASVTSAEVLDLEGKDYLHLTLPFLKDGQRMDKNKKLHTDPDYDNRTLYVPDSYLQSKEMSPGMKQWWLLKKDLFDTVIFFKVGKFYELYHMDAVIGVAELGLVFMKGKFAHCGFPEVAFGRYSEVLVQRGYKVARVEQTETPQAMNERSAKVVRREVCAVISKGTRTFSFIEGHSEESSASFLLAFTERPCDTSGPGCQGGSEFGVCFVDTSTAKFYLGQFTDDRQCSRFLTMISQYPPAQVLYERGKLSNKMQHIFNHELSSAIKDSLVTGSEFWDSTKTLKIFRDENYFNDDITNKDVNWPKLIKSMLADGDIIGTEVSKKYQLAISALGGCTWYLKKCCIDHELLSMHQFQEYVPMDQNITTTKDSLPQYMVLDGITLTNLEITVNSDGNTNGTLLQLLDQCVTMFGKRTFMQWICSPLCGKAAIDNRLDAVEDLMNIPSLISEARTVMKSIPDLERILRRVHSLGSLRRSKEHPDSRAIFYNDEIYSKKKIGDLLAALDGFKKAEQVIDLFQKQSSNFKSSLVKSLLYYDPVSNKNGQFPDLSPTLKFFQNAFDHKKAKDTGLIHPKPGVVLEYDQALNDIELCEKKLDDYLKEQKKRLGCSSIVYWGKGNNRYQMEIPESALRSHTPNDYHLKSQRKGFKRYQSAQIEKLVADLNAFEETRDALLKDTMRNIFNRFDKEYQTWEKSVKCLSILDCLLSLATYSLNIEGLSCRPQVCTLLDENGNEVQPFFEFVNCRHPCMPSASDLIPNDILLGKNEQSGNNKKASCCLLITGPNMGGKSTLMRQAGVLLIMAQMGSYVPAEVCRFTPVDRVFTRLGARDRILHGESTFFVELSETSTIFRHATKHSLVLLDELGRGTATYDGTAIASAVLHELSKGLGCRTLFSTHYHGIVDEFANTPNVKVGHMACMVECDNEDDDPTKENITFLYKLTSGACPKSYGFNAAKLAGIPLCIIKSGHVKAKQFEELARKIRILRSILSASPNELRRKLQLC